MNRTRVVITGVAGVTPLANNMETTWRRLVAGESGIGPITQFDASGYDARIAGEVKDFVPEDFIPAKQAKRMDRFTHFSVASARMLLQDAAFEINESNAADVGVIFGIGIGGLRTIETHHARLLAGGPGKVSPFLIPMMISNMGPGQIAIMTGARGPNVVTTTACASALHGIGHAFGEILLGRIRAAITGGVEAAITPLGVAGFTALKALSTRRNDTPELASRPFDAERDGFVMGEGAGLMLLEPLEDALRRGARIYAELVGYGASDDAFHMTAPSEDGSGMALAMRGALRDAGIPPEAVGHINAHATSTRMNDSIETRAIKSVFGAHASRIRISATKSMTGHLLGASGGIESVFTALALHHETLPGTINLEHPDPECDLDYLAGGSERVACEYAMCNSFGFGGTNASLILKKWAA